MKFSSVDFKKWLRQTVWVSGDCRLERKEYIPRFAEDLQRWMFNHGYKMNSRWSSLAVARWLYSIHLLECVYKNSKYNLSYPTMFHRNWQEDRDKFEVILMPRDYEAFWDAWRNNEDFDPMTAVGTRTRNELPDMLYWHLNLDTSKHGRAVARVVDEMEEDEEEEVIVGKKNEKDSYYQDVEDGFFGGRGYKV